MVYLPQKKCLCSYFIIDVTSSWTEQFDPKGHPDAQCTREVICLFRLSKRLKELHGHLLNPKKDAPKEGSEHAPQESTMTTVTAKICLISVVCRLLWVIFFLSCLCSFFGHSLWPDTFFCRLPRRQSHLYWMWCPSHSGFLSPERISVLPVCLWGQPTSVAPEGCQPTQEAYCWTLYQVSAVSLQQLSGPIHE